MLTGSIRNRTTLLGGPVRESITMNAFREQIRVSTCLIISQPGRIDQALRWNFEGINVYFTETFDVLEVKDNFETLPTAIR
jgi:hypothetical protein